MITSSPFRTSIYNDGILKVPLDKQNKHYVKHSTSSSDSVYLRTNKYTPTIIAVIQIPSKMYMVRRRLFMLNPRLLWFIFTLMINRVALLFYRPTRLKSIQINKTSGSIHDNLPCSCVSTSPSGNFSTGVSPASCNLSPNRASFLLASSYLLAAWWICPPTTS